MTATATATATVASMSRRCLGEIAAVANGTLRGWGSAYSADPHIRAQRGGGIATRERITTPDDLAKRVIDEERTYEPNDDGYTMFLLTRTNRQVGKLASALDANGIPYDVISSKDHQQPWSDPLPLLFKALRLIGQGRDIRHAPRLIPDTFGKYYAGDAETTTELADRHVEDVIARLTRTPDTRGRYKLTQRERDRLRNAIENDVTTDPGRYSKRVRVGTIHSAKGLEAPCVYLFDGYTAKTRKAYYSSKATAAEEHRLYYVGVTRASQKLIVATGYKNMGTSVFPGFENGLPRDDRTVVVENGERDGADGDEEVAA